jgi:hypothetical protein
MKNFASPSFYRTFDLLLSTINSGAKSAHWTHDGVEWMRDRYSMSGHRHGIIIKIYTPTRPGRRGWSLMVIKENWWAGNKSETIKTSRCAARPAGGAAISWNGFASRSSTWSVAQRQVRGRPHGQTRRAAPADDSHRTEPRRLIASTTCAMLFPSRVPALQQRLPPFSAMESAETAPLADDSYGCSMVAKAAET